MSWEPPPEVQEALDLLVTKVFEVKTMAYDLYNHDYTELDLLNLLDELEELTLLTEDING